MEDQEYYSDMEDEEGGQGDAPFQFGEEQLEVTVPPTSMAPPPTDAPFQFGEGLVGEEASGSQASAHGYPSSAKAVASQRQQMQQMQQQQMQQGGLEDDDEEEDWIGGKTQDYLALARMHHMQAPYTVSQMSMGADRPSCVLCNKNQCGQVLFPCEHSCICDKCMQKESFCANDDPRAAQGGCCSCPLCAALIRKILPYENGKEVGKYWKWVNEVNPQLPNGFLKNWRHSAAVIQKIRIDDVQKEKQGSRACVIQ